MPLLLWLAVAADAQPRVSPEVKPSAPRRPKPAAPAAQMVCRPPVSTFRVPEEITFCGERVPMEAPYVKERLEREFYYMLDKEGQLVLYLKRLARTSPVVERYLEKEGLSRDLKYVPVAESALVFRAVSNAGAVGYWQMVRGTGRRYGLRIDRYVDERRDLKRSTKAAVKYLKELREKFGSWPTALACYNWGEKNVSRAIEAQGTKSYYGLYVPDETDRFVFRIMALKLVLENPERYGIRLPEAEFYQEPETKRVKVSSKRSITVDVLAGSAGMDPRTFRFLNPWMIQSRLAPGTYAFRVPPDQKEGYAERVAKGLSVKGEIVHVVRRGDSLGRIASRYGVTIRQLERWNGISRKKHIHPGQRLLIQPDH